MSGYANFKTKVVQKDENPMRTLIAVQVRVLSYLTFFGGRTTPRYFYFVVFLHCTQMFVMSKFVRQT